ncbi:MAG: hypothetical protein KF749_10120 [Bacteroidetes bacterium]|nr:hypothetical protein [Bacteroidota bacterium]MCW5896681.1 hypothetical protein [Bacteroidota bacterium]
MPARHQSASFSGSSGKNSLLWRYALFAFVVASVIWLGAVNARMLIGNDILKTGTAEFLEYVNPDAEREVYRLLSMMSVAVIGGYAIALTSSIVFMVSSPFRVKEHGWLLMSAILFYLFVPVEMYTLFLDWKMIYLEFFTTADNEMFREIFMARIRALQGIPLIAMLSYYTVIGLAVFQPMKNRPDLASGEQEQPA